MHANQCTLLSDISTPHRSAILHATGVSKQPLPLEELADRTGIPSLTIVREAAVLLDMGCLKLEGEYYRYNRSTVLSVIAKAAPVEALHRNDKIA